jgi:cytochrome b561
LFIFIHPSYIIVLVHLPFLGCIILLDRNKSIFWLFFRYINVLIFDDNDNNDDNNIHNTSSGVTTIIIIITVVMIIMITITVVMIIMTIMMIIIILATYFQGNGMKSLPSL